MLLTRLLMFFMVIKHMHNTNSSSLMLTSIDVKYVKSVQKLLSRHAFNELHIHHQYQCIDICVLKITVT